MILISGSGSGFTIKGSTLTIATPGNYQLTGSLSNGQVIVNCSEENIVRLILNGVTITSSNSAPLFISKGNKVLIYLNDNTSNTLTDGSQCTNITDNEPNAAIFSKTNLSFAGPGSLTVNGNYKDGIASKDGLVIKSGNITVKAADDAIRGKDYLIIHDGNFNLTSGGDALLANNDQDEGAGFITVDGGNFTITSAGDAVSAFSDLNINHAGMEIKSGGGNTYKLTATSASAKGLKSKTLVKVIDGTFDINTADDALHSNGSILIEKGYSRLAIADDALHAEGAITISNGTIDITTCYEGIESPAITVNGGTTHMVGTNDGFNASKGSGGERNDGSFLKITGGNIVVDISNGDGLDSNGDFTMTGETVIVHGPRSNPEVGLDVNGATNVNGGFLVISGTNSKMTEAPSTTSQQYAVLVRTNSALAANTLFRIQDTDGKDLVTF